MKITKIISISFSLMFFSGIAAYAQGPGTPLPKCRANADQIYYVDSGQQVAEVRPGGNGYQLNILGAGANKFTLIKEPYMASVSLIPGYTNATAAKWQISFAPRMGQQLSSVRMMSECTGRAVSEYPLIVTVQLLDQ